MRSSGGFPPGDFFVYSKKSDPAVSGFFFETQMCIDVKDVDGVKTTNRHPKFMIHFLLSDCYRLVVLTILLA